MAMTNTGQNTGEKSPKTAQPRKTKAQSTSTT
ncbi:carbonic anhydrase, partial [Vibrio parahaemolyticus SBR10290]